MYNSIRLFVLSSLLLSVVFPSICSHKVNVDYDSGYTYHEQINDNELAALHALKNELKNRGEIDLLLWLDGILKEVYYVDHGSGYQAYSGNMFVYNILDQMSDANDKVVCLRNIKSQFDLEFLEDEVSDQKHKIKRLKRQAKTTVFDRVKSTLSDYTAPIILATLTGAWAMILIHHEQVRPKLLALDKSLDSFVSAATSKVWDVAKGLCPYAPKV